MPCLMNGFPLICSTSRRVGAYILWLSNAVFWWTVVIVGKIQLALAVLCSAVKLEETLEIQINYGSLLSYSFVLQRSISYWCYVEIDRKLVCVNLNSKSSSSMYICVVCHLWHLNSLPYCNNYRASVLPIPVFVDTFVWHRTHSDTAVSWVAWFRGSLTGDQK
jgi:hypothetical protein